jgi:SAM-dependent methyltransferase
VWPWASGGQRLLDAGCGAGEEARELARLAGPDGEVTAIDLSGDLVAAARRRGEGTGVRYAVGATSPRWTSPTRRSMASGRNACSSTSPIQTGP